VRTNAPKQSKDKNYCDSQRAEGKKPLDTKIKRPALLSCAQTATEKTARVSNSTLRKAKV